MSIMDFFRGGNQQQAPAVPTGEGSHVSPANPSMDNPAKPNPEPEKLGLDKFEELFKPIDPNDPNAPKDFDPSNIFNIDPAKINEAVQNINFSDVITSEMMTKINEGGEGAMQAMAQAMNAVAQKTFSTSILANAKMTENALTIANQHLGSKFDRQIKQNKVADSLRTANPALDHPAAKPIVTALEGQLALKYPQASAEELTKMAQSYLESFAGIASGHIKEDPKPQSASDVDWEEFMKM